MNRSKVVSCLKKAGGPVVPFIRTFGAIRNVSKGANHAEKTRHIVSLFCTRLFDINDNNKITYQIVISLIAVVDESDSCSSTGGAPTNLNFYDFFKKYINEHCNNNTRNRNSCVALVGCHLSSS